MRLFIPRGVRLKARRPHGQGRLRSIKALPRAMWICAALAALNGAVWAVFTPLGQGPDETAHMSYVQTIAATGNLPGSSKESRPTRGAHYPPDLQALLVGLPFSGEGPPSWSPQQDQAVRRIVAGIRFQTGTSNYVTSNPPLYYAIAAIPTRLADGLDAFNRLLIMRLVSAILAAVTVAFVFLFMRELMPRTPWAWSVGALAVAFQPLFGHMSGAVSVDNALFATSAALFYLTARGFNRGLGLGLGASIGLAAALGVLTKGTTFGLLPGVAFGLLALAWRSPRVHLRRTVASLAVAAVVFSVPVGGWLWANTAVFDRPAATTTAGFTSTRSGSDPITWKTQLSYTWQFFLPRLPGQSRHHFPPEPKYGLWQTYIEGFVGRFGFFQYGFPLWANIFVALVLGVVALGAVAALRRGRVALRRRWLELVTYLSMMLGLLALISVAAYRYQATTGLPFEQARYLLPAACLWAAVVGFGAQGLGGRRFGPAVGALLVTLAVGHTLFGLLLTLGRYYGGLYG